MKDDEIRHEIRRWLVKAAKLGWIQYPASGGFPMMHVADVEKLMYGMLDKQYGGQIDDWVKEAEKRLMLK